MGRPTRKPLGTLSSAMDLTSYGPGFEPMRFEVSPSVRHRKLSLTFQLPILDLPGFEITTGLPAQVTEHDPEATR